MSTKEKILEAALTLFAENGYDGTSVELTAPAVLLIAQADRQAQCEKELLERIERHVRHFRDFL